jgi:hypothetical protein
MTRAAPWVALLASLFGGCQCGGEPPSFADASVADAVLAHAVPLELYTSCLASGTAGPVDQDDRCVHVTITSGGAVQLATWTVCGATICDQSLGYGTGPIASDGRATSVALFRCLPPGAPVDVDVCVPGFAPLHATLTPRALASPVHVPVGARNLQACPAGALDYILSDFDIAALTYELTPADGGACPLLADGGVDPPALVCPCPE